MRQVRRSQFIAGAAMGAFSLLLATGCSFSFSAGDLSTLPTDEATEDGPAAVPAEDVAAESNAILSAQVGQEADEFTCEEDLPAKVGAKIRCLIEIEGETIGATVTVTSVDGSNVDWEIQVDDAPQ